MKASAEKHDWPSIVITVGDRAILLKGACLWNIDHLQQVLEHYNNKYAPKPNPIKPAQPIKDEEK